MSEQEHDRYKAMIEKWGTTWGFKIDWKADDLDYNPPRPVGSIGRFRVLDDDDEQGFYSGTEGEIFLGVVGGAEHNNERVALHFLEDGMDEPNGEVSDLDNFEAV
jgi:hypothetical protein